MANTKIQSEQIEDGAITAAKIADGAIVASEVADNAITTAKINADAVTGAKIADNAIDSEHYTDGSIDTVHIADAQITVAKMAANSVDSDQYVDGSIDTAHIADAQITVAKMAANSVDSAQYVDGSIDTAHYADNSITGAELADNIDIAGTFDVTGATTLDSTLAVAGLTTLSGDLTLASTTANKPVLTLTDTNADSQAPDLVFRKDSSSPADGDELFRIYGYGDDDAGNATEGFLMLATMTDVTNGTEDSKVQMFTYGAGSQKDTLTLAGGKVGIGTSSPSYKLTINSADEDHIRLENGSEIGFIRLLDAGILDFWAHGEDEITFTNGSGTGSERMRIDTSGNVIQAATHIIKNAIGDSSGLKLSQESSDESRIFNHFSGAMTFGTANTERMRILAGGGLTFGGDTAAANALDDYEEGTWNPKLIGSSGTAGSYAQSTTQAHYTKIGNRVFFNTTFYVTNKGSYGGTSVISGLPFTCNGSTTACSTGSFPDSGYGTTSGNVLIVGQVEATGTRIIFYEGSRLDTQHAYADVGTGYYCNVAGNYMTNS